MLSKEGKEKKKKSEAKRQCRSAAVDANKLAQKGKLRSRCLGDYVSNILWLDKMDDKVDLASRTRPTFSLLPPPLAKRPDTFLYLCLSFSR